MAKQTQAIVIPKARGIITRKKLTTFYRDKYYNIFMNLYDIEGEEVSRSAKHWLFKQCWQDGSFSAFKEKVTGDVIFSAFAPNDFNLYWWPSKITYINERGSGVLPTGIQQVGKTCEIGYATRMKKGVSHLVYQMIDRVIDIEVLINIAQETLKLPYMIIVENENAREKLESIYERISEGCPSIFMGVNDVNAFKTMVNSNPYILDKLYTMKNQRENEIKTYLGIDNSGETDTSDRGLVDVVNANNEEINECADVFLDCMNEFADDFNKLFSTNLHFILKHPPVTSEHDEEDSMKGDNEDGDRE